jgi:hypothetical protein
LLMTALSTKSWQDILTSVSTIDQDCRFVIISLEEITAADRIHTVDEVALGRLETSFLESEFAVETDRSTGTFAVYSWITQQFTTIPNYGGVIQPGMIRVRSSACRLGLSQPFVVGALTPDNGKTALIAAIIRLKVPHLLPIFLCALIVDSTVQAINRTEIPESDSRPTFLSISLDSFVSELLTCHDFGDISPVANAWRRAWGSKSKSDLAQICTTDASHCPKHMIK